jgi:hypothetical protein
MHDLIHITECEVIYTHAYVMRPSHGVYCDEKKVSFACRVQRHLSEAPEEVERRKVACVSGTARSISLLLLYSG